MFGRANYVMSDAMQLFAINGYTDAWIVGYLERAGLTGCILAGTYASVACLGRSIAADARIRQRTTGWWCRRDTR